MNRARLIFAAVRTVAFWLLTLSLLVGAEGLGTLAALTAPDSCEARCSCHEGHGHERATVQNGSTVHHPDVHHADDACPDDCPDCNCSPGVGLGVLGLSVPTVPVRSCLANTPLPVQSPAKAAVVGIFHPPRSPV